MDPRSVGRFMADTERRLRTLENTPRVPQLTVGGIQHTTSPGFRYIAGVKSWDSPSNTLQPVRFQTTASGRVLIMVGARIEVGGADSDNEVGLGLTPVAPPTFTALDNAVTVKGPTDPVGTSTAVVVDLPPSTEIVAALAERLDFPTESENLHVIEPYLAVLPL